MPSEQVASEPDVCQSRSRTILLGATGWIGSRFTQHTETVNLPAAEVLAGGIQAALRRRQIPTLSAHDVVVNAAGARHGHLEHLYVWNSQLPTMLADCCADTGAFLVHLGSAGELGSGSPEPDAPPLTEDAAPNPQTPYAASKLMGTQRVLGNGFCVLRLFNVVDQPAQPGTPTEDILNRVRMTAPHHVVTVLNAETQRDFVTRAFVIESMAAAAAERIPGLFNICSGEPIRVSDLVVSMAQRLKLAIAGVQSQQPKVNRLHGDPGRWHLATGLRQYLTVDDIAGLLTGENERTSMPSPPSGGRE